jgi:hypothetical protein
MIKKQQKWIALVVAVTFIWLLQASSLPLNAAGSNAQASAANAEQGPDYYESVSHKAAPAKSRSILPLILIGVGAITLTAVLVLVVLKTRYDITGIWQTVWHYNELGYTYDITMTFSGDKKSGTVYEDYWGGTGTYTVDSKNVTFTIIWDNGNTGHFTGTFSDKDVMSGTFYETLWPNTGTWTATRGGATVGIRERMGLGVKCGGGR